MNLQNIFNDLQAADPEFGERISPRRSVIKNMGRIASMAALPIAFGSLLNKAYGKTNGIIDETLNFALTLEYLEWEFYKQAAASNVIPNSAAQGALNTIRDHERDHVSFLRTAIQGLNVTPVSFTAANFDFTAGGTFPQVFSNYGLMLAVAQAFEDTGVRAYKGQAGNLISSNEVLTAALQIHSVEARHASHIRQMRRALGDGTVVGTTKPWITGNQSNIGSSAVQAIYNGEDVTTQAGVNIATGGISTAAASEAFDEPLTKAEVLAIVDPFIL
jgi:rubrerythrin